MSVGFWGFNGRGKDKERRKRGAYNDEKDVDDGGGLELGEQVRVVELHFET